MCDQISQVLLMLQALAAALFIEGYTSFARKERVLIWTGSESHLLRHGVYKRFRFSK